MAALATAAVSLAVLAFAVAPASAGVWLAGDLHVHTTYSHDSYGGPGDDNTGLDDANTYGLTVAEEFMLASTRGLDYVAITDHNDIRSQSDPGFGTQGVIGVPGYENSLKTHAQMLGAIRLYENGDKGLEATRAVADSLRADGGVFQVNHPSSPDWAFRYEVPAETSEVWNLPWYYQPPFPAAADNDRALAFWQGWLDTGAKVAAVGGSDSHWAATASAQGVGQPTTWVYASEPTPAGVLAGLRGGHTFVSHQPPAYAGPQLFLEADGDRDGTYEAMVGDTVAPGSPMRVRVRGASGGFLRIVTDGGREAMDPVQVTSSEFEHGFAVPPAATWVHAQLYGEDQPAGRQAGCAAIPSDDLSGSFTYCTNRVVMLGLTSAIFLRAPEPVDSSIGVRVTGPRLASDSLRGRNIQLRIRGKKGLSAISHFVLEYRRTGRGTNRAYTTLRERLAKGTTRLRFTKGRIGETYLFRIAAIGLDGRRSAFAYSRTVFPYDDRGKGRRYSRGWRRVANRRAWLGGYSQTARRGATLDFATKGGGRIYLVARTGPSGGRAVFGRGTKKRVVSFRSRTPRNRRVVAILNRTDKRTYRFRLRVLSGTVTVDGIGVRRR
jgi:hypothetical protein